MGKAVKAVEKTFDQRPENIEKIEEGLIHETFSIKVDGKDFILQFSGKDEENHSPLEHCLQMYNLLEDTVPVPEPVTGEVQVLDGQEYIIVEKIEGESGEQNIDPEKTFNAGKTLGKIHSYTELGKEGWIKPGRDKTEVTKFKEKTLKRKKLSELEGKIEVFEEKGLENLAEKLKAFTESFGEVFPQEFRPVLVHDDFTPDNTIFQGNEVSGVIDMDYAYSGLDVRNLVKSGNAYWMHDPGADWDIRETFYEGYREERDLPENFETLEKFFRVETLAHLVAGMLELDELSKREKHFYRKELLKELEQSTQILSEKI